MRDNQTKTETDRVEGAAAILDEIRRLKGEDYVRELLRMHLPLAARTLLEVAQNPTGSPEARDEAARMIVRFQDEIPGAGLMLAAAAATAKPTKKGA